MDGEFLNNQETKPSERVSFTKQFEDACPFYLAIGMTPDDYWKGDCTLAKWYRESFRIKKKMRNEELWLQGMYIYEAMCDVSPLFQAFAKRGTKALPYPEKPYDLGLDAKDEKVEKQRKEDLRVMEKAKMRMENLMVSMANKLQKGGIADGEYRESGD